MPRPRRILASAANTKTARWLNAALRSTNLHTTLKNAVSQKLPRSAAAGLVEDHVQENYLRWLEQDALEKHVDPDAPEITIPSNVRWWAIKNSYKDLRAMGRDPVLRALLGAKTETDMKREKAEKSVSTEVVYVPLSLQDDPMFVSQQTVTLELEAEDLLSVLREKLIKAGCSEIDKHVEVVIAIADGASVPEAAMTAGISTEDAKRLMVKVRKVMQAG